MDRLGRKIQPYPSSASKSVIYTGALYQLLFLRPAETIKLLLLSDWHMYMVGGEKFLKLQIFKNPPNFKTRSKDFLDLVLKPLWTRVLTS